MQASNGLIGWRALRLHVQRCLRCCVEQLALLYHAQLRRIQIVALKDLKNALVPQGLSLPARTPGKPRLGQESSSSASSSFIVPAC